MKQIPNLLSLLRVAAAPLLVWLLVQAHFREALLCVFVAGSTDWLDGWAARKLQVSTKIGAYLDPLADKAMLVILFIALGYIGLIPVWLLVLVLGRDVVILSGSIALRVVYGERRFSPTAIGKVSTFFQILAVLLVLTHASFVSDTLRILRNTALAETAFFTAISFADYVRIGIIMTRDAAARVRAERRAQTLVDGSEARE